MITVTRIGGALGADVHGLDLAQPLDGEAVALIRSALAEHLVLFFRGQHLLGIDEHKRLARHFGEIEVAPFQRRTVDPGVLLIDIENPHGSQAANFHADNTFRPYPPLGAILQAQVLPAAGGDTCFASMHAAFDALSPRMQAYLDGLEAWHSLEQMARRLAGHGVSPVLDMDEWPPVKHPVIATHPDTGRKLLNVNYNWTTGIDGLPAAESRLILGFLFDHVRRPEFQVRLRWNVGDIAFWDNRATQHCAVPDYSERRCMQRIAIAGSPETAVA